MNDPVNDEDLRLLLLIRHFETALLELFGHGLLHGTTHTCLGQEPVPVALRPLLHAEDFVFSNHRGHGHYLARFDDPTGLLAEIMGREGAVCGGIGGSQHLKRGRYLSTGVQGESLPVAAGAALHLAHHEPGRLACVHIGDGTWGEGAVYEALNMAAPAATGRLSPCTPVDRYLPRLRCWLPPIPPQTAPSRPMISARRPVGSSKRAR